ncbi:MAG: hypothetical protein ACYDH9_04275 [Limisphaerales bacterium]
MRKFLARFGVYRVPRGLFYHRQMWQRLTVIGFRVLSIERLATHPVWRIRLKGTLAAQADLLLSQPPSIRVCARSQHWLEQQLKEWMQKILKHLGQAVPSGEIVVVRSGTYIQVTFVWPMGGPGVLAASPKHGHPLQVSLVVRRWLRWQRN